MSTPNLDAFARAQTLGTLAARRVAWSRGYLVAFTGLFAVAVAAFTAFAAPEAIRDRTSMFFGIGVLLLPVLIKRRRTQRG